MTPEQLKASILQYAMQGKLVEQRSEEGTAEEPYLQIQEKKKELIKAKKIKKEKTLAPLTDDVIPFDIPESWVWCRLSEVIDVRDGTHDSPKYVPEGIPLVTSKNLSNGTIDFGNIKYITKKDADKINERSVVDNDDILFAMIGSIGNPVLVKKDREFCIKNMALFKKYADTNIDMNYMYWFFFLVQYSLKAEASGGVQSFISLSRFREYPVPLPPFEEQHRIASKIEELLPYIDRYAEAYDKLEHFNAKFPEEMKKSILQYAIQGKLVEQRPEEGTAEELYEQIQEEKQKLIKEGKIKKEKSLADIAEDEIPFDIPENWKWVRIYDVIEIATNLVEPKDYYNYKHIAPDNIEKKSGRLLECQTVKEDNVVSPNHLFYKGQIIYSKIRPLLRKATIAPFDGLCSADMYPLNTKMNTRYILYFLLSDCFNIQVAEACSSRVKMPKINQTELGKIIVPIPPLAEQERIADKIEELLPYCDRLNENL